MDPTGITPLGFDPDRTNTIIAVNEALDEKHNETNSKKNDKETTENDEIVTHSPPSQSELLLNPPGNEEGKTETPLIESNKENNASKPPHRPHTQKPNGNITQGSHMTSHNNNRNLQYPRTGTQPNPHQHLIPPRYGRQNQPLNQQYQRPNAWHNTRFNPNQPHYVHQNHHFNFHPQYQNEVQLHYPPLPKSPARPNTNPTAHQQSALINPNYQPLPTTEQKEKENPHPPPHPHVLNDEPERDDGYTQEHYRGSWGDDDWKMSQGEDAEGNNWYLHSSQEDIGPSHNPVRKETITELEDPFSYHPSRKGSYTQEEPEAQHAQQHWKQSIGCAGTVTHLKEGWNPFTKKQHPVGNKDLIQGRTEQGEFIYGYFDPYKIPDFGQFIFDFNIQPQHQEREAANKLRIRGIEYAQVNILGPILANKDWEQNLKHRHILHGRIVAHEGSRGEVVLDNPTTHFPNTEQKRFFYKNQLAFPCSLPVGTEVKIATSVFKTSGKLKIVSIRPNDEDDLDLVKYDLAPDHKNKLCELESTNIGIFIGGAPDVHHPTFPASHMAKLKRNPESSLFEEIVKEMVKVSYEEWPPNLSQEEEQKRQQTSTRLRTLISSPFNVLINPLDFWDMDEEGWEKEIDKFFTKTNPIYQINNIFLMRRVDGGTTIENISKISSIAKWVHPCKRKYLRNVFLPPTPLSLGSYLFGEPIYRSNSKFNLAILNFSKEECEIGFDSLPLEKMDIESDSIAEDPDVYYADNTILITRPQKISQANALAFDKLGLGQRTDRPTSCPHFRNSLVRPAFQESRSELVARVNSLGQVDMEFIGGKKSRASFNPFFTFPASDFFHPKEEALALQTTIVFKDTAYFPLIEALATTEGGQRPHIHPIAFAPKEARVQCESREQLASLHRMIFTTKGTGIEAFYQKADNITWLVESDSNSWKAKDGQMQGQKERKINEFSPSDKEGIGYLEGVPLTISQKGLDKIGRLFGVQLDSSKLDWIQLREARPLLKVWTDNQLKFYLYPPIKLPSMGVNIKTAPPPHPKDMLPPTSPPACLLSPVTKSATKGLEAKEPIPPYFLQILGVIKELTSKNTPKQKASKERTLIDEWQVVGSKTKKPASFSSRPREKPGGKQKYTQAQTPKKTSTKKQKKATEAIDISKQVDREKKIPNRKGNKKVNSTRKPSPIPIDLESEEEREAKSGESKQSPPTTPSNQEQSNEVSNEGDDISSDSSDSDDSEDSDSGSTSDSNHSPSPKRPKTLTTTPATGTDTHTPSQTQPNTGKTTQHRRSKGVVPSEDESETGNTPENAHNAQNTTTTKPPDPPHKITQGTITSHFRGITPTPKPSVTSPQTEGEGDDSDLVDAKKKKAREKRQKQKKKKEAEKQRALEVEETRKEEEAERLRSIEMREKDLQRRLKEIEEKERRSEELRRETEILNSPKKLAKERERSRERREKTAKQTNNVRNHSTPSCTNTRRGSDSSNSSSSSSSNNDLSSISDNAQSSSNSGNNSSTNGNNTSNIRGNSKKKSTKKKKTQGTGPQKPANQVPKTGYRKSSRLQQQAQPGSSDSEPQTPTPTHTDEANLTRE